MTRVIMVSAINSHKICRPGAKLKQRQHILQVLRRRDWELPLHFRDVWQRKARLHRDRWPPDNHAQSRPRPYRGHGATAESIDYTYGRWVQRTNRLRRFPQADEEPWEQTSHQRGIGGERRWTVTKRGIPWREDQVRLSTPEDRCAFLTRL